MHDATFRGTISHMRKKKAPRLMWLTAALAVLAAVAIISYSSPGGWLTTDSELNFEDLALSGTQTTDKEVTRASGESAASAPSASASRKLSTVATVAQNLPNTSQFKALFKSTSVATSLTGKGPYTIFVPTNGAFSQLPPGTITKMTDAQKLRFMQYHIIDGRMIDAQAQVAGTIEAMSGDVLNFSFGADQIPLVNSAIFIHKYEASNGVVYLIDNVLLPPQR